MQQPSDTLDGILSALRLVQDGHAPLTQEALRQIIVRLDEVTQRVRGLEHYKEMTALAPLQGTTVTCHELERRAGLYLGRVRDLDPGEVTALAAFCVGHMGAERTRGGRRHV